MKKAPIERISVGPPEIYIVPFLVETLSRTPALPSTAL